MKNVVKSRNPRQAWTQKRKVGPQRQQQKGLDIDEIEVDEEAAVDLQPYQAPDQRNHQPNSTKDMRTRSDVYLNAPLTPNTPLPLLGGDSSKHKRSNSDDRRREMELTIKTDFAPPPRKGLSPRTGKGFKFEMEERGGVVGKKRGLFGRKK